MSPEVFARLLSVLLISVALSYNVFSKYDEEVGVERLESQRRYTPYISGSLLPTVVILILLMTYVGEGGNATITTLLSMYFNVFIHISFFYAILILLLPILRKHMSARSISFLWMIPNYLYILGYRFMFLEKPLFVINAPQKLVSIFFGIILLGAIVVMLTKIISHFIFRYRILKDSYPITDESILEVWNKTIAWAHIKKPKFKLVCSKNVTTPLSVGLFKRTTKVVLPEKHYTQEDLSYIFKHEIIHICREDVWSKFFLVFCTSLCWYNPLMWIAMRKCSDDIELSCDETVLVNMDEHSRKQYARLILNTTADERGFTTCLSASATALKYRLANIMNPRTRHTGAIIIGLSFLLLGMSSGSVALSYAHHSGLQAVFNSQDPSLHSILNIRSDDSTYNPVIRCVNEDEFNQYLSNLKMSTITGNYTYDMYDKYYSFVYMNPKGEYSFIDIGEDVLKIGTTYYYLDEKIDWDYFETMIVSYPALNMGLYDIDNNYNKTVETSLMQVIKDNKVLYDVKEAKDHYSGLFASELPRKATLSFSYENVVDYTILVESWDYETSYIINHSDINENGEFSLPNYPAHYTIQATLKNKLGETMKVEFWLNIGHS